MVQVLRRGIAGRVVVCSNFIDFTVIISLRKLLAALHLLVLPLSTSTCLRLLLCFLRLFFSFTYIFFLLIFLFYLFLWVFFFVFSYHYTVMRIACKNVKNYDLQSVSVENSVKMQRNHDKAWRSLENNVKMQKQPKKTCIHIDSQARWVWTFE